MLVKTTGMIIIPHIRLVKKQELKPEIPNLCLLHPAILPFQTEIGDVTVHKCLCYLILCIGVLPKGSSGFSSPAVYLLILAKIFYFQPRLSLSLLLADI